MSVVAGFSVAEPAGGPVMIVFPLFRVPGKGCVMSCSMTVIALLSCCRAVASGLFVTAFHALCVVYGDSILMQ